MNQWVRMASDYKIQYVHVLFGAWNTWHQREQVRPYWRKSWNFKEFTVIFKEVPLHSVGGSTSSQKSVEAYCKFLWGFWRPCSSDKKADKQYQSHVGLVPQRIRPPSCIIPAQPFACTSIRNLLDIFGMWMGPLLLPSPPSVTALISMR